MPFKRALRAGCDKIIVILTKPRDTVRSSGKDRLLSASIALEYPKAAEAWVNRSSVYNDEIAEVFELEKEGRVYIAAPENIGDLKTLSQDHEALEDLYYQGKKAAAGIPAFLEK